MGWILHLALGLPLGLFLANAVEWQVHRVLHRRGRVAGSFWSFHFYTHHGVARSRGFIDPGCGPRPRMILWSAVIYGPLAPVAPGVAAGTLLSLALYWAIHHRAHRDPAWAVRWVPWHVEHHMAPDEEANWCVVFPWFDWIMGTRVRYFGTDREAELRPIEGWEPRSGVSRS